MEAGDEMVYSARIGPGVNFRNRLVRLPSAGSDSFTSICSAGMLAKPRIVSFTPSRKASEIILSLRIASRLSTYTDKSPVKCLASDPELTKTLDVVVLELVAELNVIMVIVVEAVVIVFEACTEVGQARP